MKKTVLISMLLAIILIGCSKNNDVSCTYGVDALKGKLYRLQSETIDSAGVRYSSRIFNDSIQYSYSFSEGSSGLLIVKYIYSGQAPTEYTKNIDYTVLTGSSDLEIVEWNSSVSKNTYLFKVESFDCNKMVLYAKYNYLNTLFERRQTFVKQ